MYRITVICLSVFMAVFCYAAPGITECPELWNRYEGFSSDKAKEISDASADDVIEGIWEDENGATFLITKAERNDCGISYRMILIKDQSFYGNWHKLLPPGTVIGVLKLTASENMYSCDYRFRLRGVPEKYHFSLRDGKLMVSNGGQSKYGKQIAVKIYPVYDNAPSSPLKGELPKDSM